MCRRQLLAELVPSLMIHLLVGAHFCACTSVYFTGIAKIIDYTHNLSPTHFEIYAISILQKKPSQNINP